MPLSIVRQDITKMNTDAIVAAEGHDLTSHGWVSSAIAEAAGDEYQKACEELGYCDTGDAKTTLGYGLPAKYVIHTVGPRYRDGHSGEGLLLKSCYEKSLQLAKENGCNSIAFPVIATGGYGFPKDEGLKIATDTINGFLKDNEMDVYLVTFDSETTLLSRDLDFEIEEYIDDNYVGEGYITQPGRGPSRKLSCKATAPIPRNIDNCDNCDIPLAKELDIRDLVEESAEYAPRSLDSALKIKDESFQQMLLRLIEEKSLKNAEVYTKANISKSHFSKIKGNPDYKPKKETVFAFAVALELGIEETTELMMKAGYAISHSFLLDIIVEYFIVKKRYDITEINFALFDYDLPLLGEKPL